MFDRLLHPARGREGGEDGAAGWVGLKSGEPNGEGFTGKGKDQVPAGDRLVMITPGGGGYGNPQQRATEATAADEESELL